MLEITDTEVGALVELFGPAPVLPSESFQDYQQIMRLFLQGFTPRNLLEQMFIIELTNCTWEMARYTRHKTLLMQRRLLQRLAYQEQRRIDAAQREEGQDKSLPEPPTCPDDLLDQVIEEIDAILLRSDEDINHLRALEVAFLYYERIDRLLASATARRDNTLDRIERYKDKFGQHLRRVSNQAIQGAFRCCVNAQAGIGPVIP
jgi:hypothetical protein